MPRTRTYTDVGYVEVQWSKKGELVCLVSATVQKHPDGSVTTIDTMHQFTERGDMGVLLRDLTRARKQAFPEPVYSYPVTDAAGNVVAYDRYPPEHYAQIPVLDPDRIVKTGNVGKVRPAKVEYL
ncbi:MAG: hypothetical protein KA973_14250 [Candidatus Microthrix sp.]|nr:hypothetical protein [Candidatus Microthrix sp.]